MEDYKEKYEQAMLRMNKWVEGSEIIEPKEVAEFVFPELKKSEDEKIRKEILSFLKEFEYDHYRNLDFSSWIAWLEKQGEQLCWIKCSDGLPNRDGTYLVVTDGRHNDVYDMAKYDSIEGWHKSSEVIYWMPIPQLNNKSIIEQKPAWSEKHIADVFEKVGLARIVREQGNDQLTNAIQSAMIELSKQKKTAWSEEDEIMLNNVVSTLEPLSQTTHSGYAINSMINWLKSIKERMKRE